MTNQTIGLFLFGICAIRPWCHEPVCDVASRRDFIEFEETLVDSLNSTMTQLLCQRKEEHLERFISLLSLSTTQKFIITWFQMSHWQLQYLLMSCFHFSDFFLLFYSMQVSTKALDCKMPVACSDQESVLISSEASWTGSVNILLLYWQLQPYWTLSGLTCIANLPSLFNWKLLTLKRGQRKFMKLDKRSFGSVMFSFHTN